MADLYKLTAHETGDRLLTVKLVDTPDAHLEFEVNVKFDSAKLKGPLDQEKRLLIAQLQQYLDLLLRQR